MDKNQLQNLSHFLKRTAPDEQDLILTFGSEKSGRDIDLTVISINSPSYEQIQIGMLDITIIPLGVAIDLAQHLDFLVTEPILSGSVLVNNHFVHEKLRKMIQHHNKKEEIIRHYLMQALRCRLSAESYLDVFQKDMSNREYAGRVYLSLSWVCSYFIGARKYAKSNKIAPVMFSDLKKEKLANLLFETRLLLKRCENIDDSIEFSKALDMADLVDRHFLLAGVIT